MYDFDLIEAELDRRVQARLSTDRDYCWAENAEEQALAERKIELQEESAILHRVQTTKYGDRASWNSIQRRIEAIDVELEGVYDELRKLVGVRPGDPMWSHYTTRED